MISVPSAARSGLSELMLGIDFSNSGKRANPNRPNQHDASSCLSDRAGCMQAFLLTVAQASGPRIRHPKFPATVLLHLTSTRRPKKHSSFLGDTACPAAYCIRTELYISNFGP